VMGVGDVSGGPRFTGGLFVFMSALRWISAVLDTGDINTTLKRYVSMYTGKGSNALNNRTIFLALPLQ
jgi:hypothetical protein